jgi:glutathione synthase/RimK-type ligase-like ATP-grasp enzyme
LGGVQNAAQSIKAIPTVERDQMKIVVLAHTNDNHTAPIKWAAEQAGYKVACWGGLASTEKQQASVSFNGNTSLTLGPHSVEAGDVVWVRRPQPSEINPKVSESDKKFAEGEYRWFQYSLIYLIEALSVRVVNKYSASRYINNKSVQILLAKKCGMHVPETLMSNSPAEVRRFLEKSLHRTICKAFFPHVWKKDSGGVAVTETFEINAASLPSDDEVLTYAPAIYQQMVVKKFDVRMVLLGTTVYSYALHNPKGALDWRQDAGQGLVEVEVIDTPPEVERAMLAFAREAGITFGSADFAIDSDGKWWFLEINEQGQFLWLDQFNPKVNMQQKFLAFMTLPEGASRQQIEERQLIFPSMSDYDKTGLHEQLEPEVQAGAGFVSTEP